jgi:4-aminobutyrate aminotransferase-like enzyme/Ser/Thr protein kinase RdoA (MazF antagonist)
MMSVVKEVPRFSGAEAVAVVRRYYGLEVTARPLASERDQNFLLRDGSGRGYVLKIANRAEVRGVLELQNRVMRHLNENSRRRLCPSVVSSLEGEEIVTVKSEGGETHHVRLLTFLEGVPLGEVNPHTPDLLDRLGRFVGRLVQAARSLAPQPCQLDLIWNMKNGPDTVRRFRDCIEGEERRRRIDHFLELYETAAGPLLPDLATGIIHNDGNDYNIIVSPPASDPPAFGSRSIAGIIDFGDLTRSYTLSELAVASAYAMLAKEDPLAAAARVAAGYHAVVPLSEPEVAALYPLICLRLIMSVSICAFQKKENPDNPYLTISEEKVWQLLEKLYSIHPRLAHYRLRRAVGLEPCPRTSALKDWLQVHQAQIGPVTAHDLRTEKLTVFDFGVGSLLLQDAGGIADIRALTDLLFGQLKREAAPIGIGRYNEARLVYTSDLFRSGGSELAEGRTVHLGMDLFAAPGSPVFAPLDGTVHSFQNNESPLDYGPAIVLEHAVAAADGGKITFYTLYGHLGLESLSGLYRGKAISKGERLARVGDFPVNGGWVPHLHFQVMTDMLDFEGDYPGVARWSEKEVWLSLCPDPNLLLRIPPGVLKSETYSPAEILELRQAHIASSLSIAYQKPLKIVRGFRQYLYDDTGRRFLDAVNNVPQVGHSHPRVVEAAARQMAVLNTNTRYLHDNLVRYTRRLCDTMPEPLKVCFIVNSGSEANDLALRLAWNYTGRRDIVCVDGAYHGNLSSLIDISPYKFNGPGGKGKPEHTQVVARPDLYQGAYRYDDPQAGEKYGRQVGQAVASIEAQGRGAAAFICESLMGCGGQIVLPQNYLKAAYRQMRRAGGLCIADEVQVGFGRVGECFWGFQTQQVVPDIVTLGKPIGGGHPLAAVITTGEIAAAFANGMEYFNTFGGNPVSCAVGLTVLDVIREERLQENAQEVGSHLKAGLIRLQEKYPLIGDVRGLGLFIGVELVLDRESRKQAPQQAAYIANRLREEGILISTDGPFDNVLKIKPPLVFTLQNADLLIDTLDHILAEDPLQI